MRGCLDWQLGHLANLLSVPCPCCYRCKTRRVNAPGGGYGSGGGYGGSGGGGGSNMGMGLPAGTIITPQMLSAAGIIPASLVASMLQNAGMTGALVLRQSYGAMLLTERWSSLNAASQTLFLTSC